MGYWTIKKEWFMRNMDFFKGGAVTSFFIVAPLAVGYLVTFLCMSTFNIPFESPWSLMITITTAILTFSFMLVIVDYLNYKDKMRRQLTVKSSSG